MRKFFFTSVRTRLILLVSVALVPVALLIWFNGREQENRAMQQARAQAGIIFDLAVVNEQKVLLETRELLARLAEDPEVVRRGDCGAYLSAFLKNYPRYSNLGVIRADGNVVCSGVPFDSPMRLADRSYFRGALENRAFSIGTYQVGRITGKPAVHFGYPIVYGMQETAGVVFAAMDPAFITEFDTEVSALTPAGSTLLKIDSEGAVMNSYPRSPVHRIGSPLEKTLFGKISREKKGTITLNDADGVERMYMFSTLWGANHGEESYVALGIPMEELLSESRGYLVRNLVFLALVTAGTALAMWFVGYRLIVHPVSVVVDASKQFASGDLAARASLSREGGEFGQLGLAFDEMAGELERKARKLSSIRARLARILSASPAVVYACRVPSAGEPDKGFSPVFLSEKVRDLFGYEVREVLDNPAWWMETVHPDDLPKAIDRGELFRSGSLNREYRVRTKGGSYRWILDQAVLANDREDDPGEIVGSWTDITDRKQAEETLVRLEMAVNQAAEAVVVTDTEGKIGYANPAFERITGYSSRYAVGQNIRMLKSGKQDEAFYRNMWETISRGGVWEGRIINRKKDGSLYEEDATVSPVRDASGRIVNYVSGKRDVTREVALQKQLQTAQRLEAVGTLAGGIAHDFNNALTGIYGFTELALREAAGNGEAESHLNEIRKCAERAATLTRQLLAYSRRQILTPVHLDLNLVVTELMKLVSKVAGEEIRIQADLDKELPTVCADIGQIEQVLMNLVINARDAMPSGGRLLVETGVADVGEEYVRYHPYMKAGRFVVLSVSDTGTGMDEATRERVFDPFFTTKAPDRGSGLGLAMVYGIVKQHKGFIHLYSEPGAGTTFRIYLPAVDAAPDAIEAPKPAEISGGTETVLLAEDDESVRMLVKRTLENLGYNVRVACNGAEAVELFRRDPESISLVLLDAVMAEMGGKEAHDAMRRTKPGLKAIFMSGYTANAIHESFVLLPGVPFLPKPFTPNSLARKVREVLDSRD